MISNIESGDNEIDNLVARIDKLKKNKATEVEEINFLLTCPEVKPSGDHIKVINERYDKLIGELEEQLQRLQRQNRHDQPERDETLHIRTKKSRRGSDDSDTASATVSNENDNMEEDSESDDIVHNNDDGSMSDDSSCNSDDEEAEGDDDTGEIRDYHVDKIMQSALSMATQGFRSISKASSNDGESSLQKEKEDTTSEATSEPFDPVEVTFDGKIYCKRSCYVVQMENTSCIVGIKHFVSEDTASCILIEKFEHTILGMTEDGSPYTPDYMIGTYVQINDHVADIHLSKLEESESVDKIPRLIYHPQTPGDWYTCGYWFEEEDMPRRKFNVQKKIHTIEAFAGAGGSLLGYHSMAFETALAIEKDSDAVSTLKANFNGLKVYEGCIKEFTKNYDSIKCFLDKPDHIHFSSPCQDFSGANRSVNTENRRRADLSLLLIDLVRLTSCSTAVFENVIGIWKRNNIHYLKNIAKELMKLGYLAKWTVLHGCDYGDPQRRPRVIMFIWKSTLPPPSFPTKTHGPGTNCKYVTVSKALSFKVKTSLTNMKGKTTRLKPGQHGVCRLMPHGVAPTIRASSTPPLHPTEDRCVTVREAACLQSFPLNYKICGKSLGSQYRQVGNAVPVELACAIARSIKDVYCFEYASDDEGE